MKILEKCEHCDTVLVYGTEQGESLRFIAHDDDFCRLGMKIKIDALERALKIASFESHIRASERASRARIERAERYLIESTTDLIASMRERLTRKELPDEHLWGLIDRVREAADSLASAHAGKR